MKAVKQNPRQATVVPSNGKAASAWDRIVPVADSLTEFLRLNIYGMPGTGKTTLACTFPKPVLILGFEDGTKSVKRVPGVDFVLVENSSDIEEFVDGLKARRPSRCMPGKPYATVAVDTLTSMQDLILKEMMGWEKTAVQLKRPSKKGGDSSHGVVPRQVYMDRASKTKEMLRLLMDCTPGFAVPAHVLVLAQQKDHTKKDEEGMPIAPLDPELMLPHIASSAGQATCEYLAWQCDWICQTFVREKVIEENYEQKMMGKTVTKTRVTRTGKPEFCLRTSCSHPIYAAKVRKDKAINLPDVLVDPSYEKIVELVGAM